LFTPLPSKDGKKLFVVGRSYRGDLERGDSKSGQFTPFLSGISAEDVVFSKDGQWVAYVSYLEGILWRSKAGW
jgi:eukaryotic-like serine/threonine-protein kinase